MEGVVCASAGDGRVDNLFFDASNMHLNTIRIPQYQNTTGLHNIKVVNKKSIREILIQKASKITTFKPGLQDAEDVNVVSVAEFSNCSLFMGLLQSPNIPD